MTLFSFSPSKPAKQARLARAQVRSTSPLRNFAAPVDKPAAKGSNTQEREQQPADPVPSSSLFFCFSQFDTRRLSLFAPSSSQPTRKRARKQARKQANKTSKRKHNKRKQLSSQANNSISAQVSKRIPTFLLAAPQRQAAPPSSSPATNQQATMKMDFGAAAGIPIPDFQLMPLSSSVSSASPPLPMSLPGDVQGQSSGQVPATDPSETSYGSPNRMQVLANGDIIDCGRLPQTARNNLYKTELCKHFMDTGACRYGTKCQFAHGEHELRGVLRHPKYKTTRCKAFVSTGKCMYGNRCRFIHGDNPEDDQADSFSSTGSESDDQESPLKDLTVNPYVHGTESIDLLIPFGGLKQVTLTPLTSIGSSVASPASPSADIDAFLFRDPFSAATELKLTQDANDMSSITDALGALSPSAESATAKFSRLSIFQRICREDA